MRAIPIRSSLRPAHALLAAMIVLSKAPSAIGQTGPAAAARGDSLMESFRTSEAVAAYRQGLAGAAGDATLLWKTSRALLNLAEERPGKEGDEALYREAVELARRAVRAAPEAARPHATLAAALGRLALFEGGKRKVELAREVRSEADLAARLDPSDFAAFVVLGILERELATLNPFLKAFARTFFGRLPEASEEGSAAHLERAVRLEPEYITPRVELARTYLELDREADARRELEAALELPPREEADRIRQREARELLGEID
ncbi:MAG TPA: tetratricopeptide repeat protein [Gemmatimonadota bacterium]|nr:tetratricopeptide repeat protein [Gemmatimonadota bacterium]